MKERDPHRVSRRSYLALNLLAVVGVLLVWEFLGRMQGWFPAATAVFEQIWHDRGDYAEHVPATLRVAILGFVIGNAFAILAGLILSHFEVLDGMLEGTFVALFSVPLLVLTLIVDGSFTNRFLGAIAFVSLAVFFPTLENFKLGLVRADPYLVDVVRVAGGGPWNELLKVRLRSALPSLMAALQASFPVSILGAMLSDFSGAQSGLGKYLIGSLGQAYAPRIWGISLVSSFLAVVGFAIFGQLSEMLGRSSLSERVLEAHHDRREEVRERPSSVYSVWARKGISFVFLPIVVWQLYSWFFSGRLSVKGPVQVLHVILATLTASDSGRSNLWSALPSSLGIAIVGVVVSVMFAFALSVVLVLAKSSGQVLVPFAVLTQAVPIVAWIPVLRIILGDGLALTVAVTISVSFFPGFIFLFRGLMLIPGQFIDLMETYNASHVQIIRLVRLPAAIPYLLGAIRLTAPRALLGVILAEYMVTSSGLGGLLYRARGAIDFGTMWTVAAITAGISVILFGLFRGLGSVLAYR